MIHQNGKVEIVDRLDRMIKVNGEQVYLDKLEMEVNAFYKSKQTAFARPRATRVPEEFPVTNVGKIDFKEPEKIA